MPDDPTSTDDTGSATSGWTPPASAEVHETWPGPDGPVAVTTRAEWIVLREEDRPVAELFSVACTADDAGADRPVTFVFNGGPGASSAYLHLGALGPRRVAFAADGTLLPPPSRLVDNTESWLAFTDLVFVDPVGTGFSRVVDHGTTREPNAPNGSAASGQRDKDDPKPDPKAFFGVKRDLESLGEFVTRWLSTHERWSSPVLIAGESYGGFRAAKLVRSLPETWGVGLSGAILISPAMEFATLDPTDYDVLPWVDLLPTMAAAAAHHGRSRAFDRDTPLDDVLAGAREFATGPLLTALVRGASMPADDRDEVLGRLADLLGLDAALVSRAEGRISMEVFARELLRDEGRRLALYDASQWVRDPFPDRDSFGGPDPSLMGIGRVYAAGINQRLRGEIGVETDRPYELLSYDVNESWKVDLDNRHGLDGPIGATDDLRYGMALDPSVQVLVTHGYYDLVTPFHASDRLRDLMRLDPDTAARVHLQHFPGGHMFYGWDASRRDFRDLVAGFYDDAVRLD
ncbi:S10 family peptidase [Salsipaludibacter albus]|uniref:S10 family peptidase n=1 Tax=Salsipaludibacter albus TaxID=2849650 RepID=UPI001EE409C2|nr:peptidase S10 [Salsipaludibacter albus]MBY5161501.1 peptidase S10 [Salsipaludibacter albus]